MAWLLLYRLFGSKRGILSAVLDVAFGGVDEPIEFQERPAVRDALAEPDPGRLPDAFARIYRELLDRSAAVQRVFAGPPQSTPKLPGSGRAAHHADRADRPTPDRHRRVDLTWVEIGLGLQGDKRAGDYAKLAALAESQGFDVLSVFGDLMFQPPIFPLLEMAAATERVAWRCLLESVFHASVRDRGSGRRPRSCFARTCLPRARARIVAG
jgi:AcrR family transcriptional regulator